jgi:hypothetical protein
MVRTPEQSDSCTMNGVSATVCWAFNGSSTHFLRRADGTVRTTGAAGSFTENTAGTMQITPFRSRLYHLLALFCQPKLLQAGEWSGYARSEVRLFPHVPQTRRRLTAESRCPSSPCTTPPGPMVSRVSPSNPSTAGTSTTANVHMAMCVNWSGLRSATPGNYAPVQQGILGRRGITTAGRQHQPDRPGRGYRSGRQAGPALGQSQPDA